VQSVNTASGGRIGKNLAIQTYTGFILTRNWRDTPAGIELEFWLSCDQGPICIVVRGERSAFFLAENELPQAREILVAESGIEFSSVQLRDFQLNPVVAVYCQSHRRARRSADLLRDRGLNPLESDINPAQRYLMERFITSGAIVRGDVRQRGGHVVLNNPKIKAADYKPELKVVSYDIETAMDTLQLYSIAVYACFKGVISQCVFMLGEGADQDFVVSLNSQEELLDAFLAWIDEYDPDVLIGWNVVNFDTWYLQRIADVSKRRLALGRDGRQVRWRELDDEGQRRNAQLDGRVILDGIELLRAAFYRFESFSLENVSRQLLGEGKLLHGSDRGGQIGELFQHDKSALADYNLKDCRLVHDIFDHTALMAFAVARSQLTGLNIDRMGGSVASFDNLYLPTLHRRGYVAPNASTEAITSPGGFVLDSMPGLYDHVLVLDFKSLYPSIIRTFFIDPLGLALGVKQGGAQALDESQTVPGYLEARYAREGHILPELIADLWLRRDEAKSRKDTALSQAIKIIMNSFYGVLGTPACRFFDARLASSITRRGHDILIRSRDFIENAGQTVIYGDTDSVFVWVRDASNVEQANAIGRQLVHDLNGYWHDNIREEFELESILEVEFETHFKRFLMPTIRGSDKGSKKRYAGVVDSPSGEKLVFKGLENVRTDWTRLAREFQEELYRRIFNGEVFEQYVKDVCVEVLEGQRDEQLVYRKRLRRKLVDYERNIPPHVRAARLCEARGLEVPHRGSWVEYVMTQSGAEPAANRLAELDYQHYVDRQLEPVADGILGFVGTSFRTLVDKQIALF
jgi:DNA polymerase-2